MPDTTPVLQLPYILPSQAQKHVTHNEAIRLLDVIVQLSVLARNLPAPPPSPVQGDRYIVATGAAGLWSGQTGRVALYENGAWQFFAPLAGWTAWVQSEQVLTSYTGTAWVSQADGPFNVGQLGVSATPDATNRLTVSAPATLLNHAGAGHQVKINKALTADTASLLFQTGFSGRAEMGTAGSDDFAIKVSADGSAFFTGLSIAAASGQVTLPAAARLGGQASDPVAPADGTIWLNSTTGEVKLRSAGATIVLALGALGVSDGAKGDITVSGGGGAWVIDAGAVGNAKLAPMPNANFKARLSAGTGAPEDISAEDAAGLLPVFSATAKGLAPASGGGTANFLRADGTWAAPSGGGGGTSLASLGVTATAAELNALDGVTPAGTAIVQANTAAAQRAFLGFGAASDGLFMLGAAGNLARGAADVGNPVFWVASVSSNGVTATRIASGIDTDGLPYNDWTITGTATGNSLLLPYTVQTSPAATGETRTASISVQVIAGAAPTAATTGFRLDVIGSTASTVDAEVSFSSVFRPLVPTIITRAATFATAGIIAARTRLVFRTDAGVTVNYTVRLKGLQFDAGPARVDYRWFSATPSEARAALGLVGAVTSSAGSPIIERGSNANGEFVRFADGTMICWVQFTKNNAVTGAQSFSLPVMFASLASLSATVSQIGETTSMCQLSTLSQSTFSITARLIADGSLISATRSGSFIAIGRWF